MAHSSVTRGTGLLENWLAWLRARQANRLIPPSYRTGRLLDLGCGRYPYFLSTTRFEEKYGIDQGLDPDVTWEAGPQKPVLICQNVELDPALPFQSGCFEVVTMLAVVEHIDPSVLPLLFTEIHRTLKPNGVFILTTPASWSDPLLRLLARLRLVSPVEINDHKAAYTPGSLAKLFTRTPFASDAIHMGYFECLLNLWATARRSAPGAS